MCFRVIHSVFVDKTPPKDKRNARVSPDESSKEMDNSFIQSSMKRRVWKALTRILFLHVTGFSLLFVFHHPIQTFQLGIFHSLYSGLKLGFILFLLDVCILYPSHLQIPCFLYVWKTYEVQPCRTVSFWERFCECFHLKHILLWLSLPATYAMIQLVPSKPVSFLVCVVR